ncbi:hypothetical protein RA307_06270 [Xanthobacteraceae bacterium Astr-EGSB]|uniref:hypothetical protein n=1 Tax=Astrobacterium formosum TaxID=3069710 RepID=UPI0027B10233|nr:hypothetical protein [Xanthobacteraceae bacterium Astr-EGSB]
MTKAKVCGLRRYSLLRRSEVQLIFARDALAGLAIAFDAILHLSVTGRELSQNLELTGRGVVLRKSPLEKNRVADIESMSGLLHIHHCHGLLRVSALGRPAYVPGRMAAVPP